MFRVNVASFVLRQVLSELSANTRKPRAPRLRAPKMQPAGPRSKFADSIEARTAATGPLRLPGPCHLAARTIREIHRAPAGCSRRDL